MRGLFRRNHGGRSSSTEHVTSSGSASASGSGAQSANTTTSQTNAYGNGIEGMSLEALVRGSHEGARQKNDAAKHLNGNRVVPTGAVGAADGLSTAAPIIDPATADFGFHSMALQIKDPERSLPFYSEVLGMRLVKHTESDDYSMYFYSFGAAQNNKQQQQQQQNQHKHFSSDDEALFGQQKGLLQLIHVHGTEHDDSFKVFTAGPGFTHFTISVPDVDRARQRMESLGVNIVEDGSNARGFAAVSDPDGYNIQLIGQTQGQDDQLRAQLEQLMNEQQDTFQLSMPPSKNLGRGGGQAAAAATTGDRQGGELETLSHQSSPTMASLGNVESIGAKSIKSQHEKERILHALQTAKGGSPILSPASSPAQDAVGPHH